MIRRILLSPAQLVILLAVPTILSCAPATRFPCYIDVPVFGPTGDTLSHEYEIVAARWYEGHNPPIIREANLLTSNTADRMEARGTRLYFTESARARAVQLVLRKRRDKKDRFSGVLELAACGGRASLQVGQRFQGDDVFATRVYGRLVGCKLGEDWWLRAMPMFGGYMDASVYEGKIRASDGSFSLIAGLRGERHIFVIGKGRDPVKAVGINVIVGGRPIEVGNIDISGSCPTNGN